MEAARVDRSNPRSRGHWGVLGAGLGVALVLLTGAFLLEPDPRGFGTHERLGLPPCMPMQLWNVPCPGCGVTTSVTLAARGRLLDSLATQPLGFVLALAAAAFVVWTVVGALAGRDLWVDLQRLCVARWAGVGGGLVALAWAYKIASVRGWL